MITEGHFFPNQQLCVFNDLFSVCVQSFRKAVAVYLTVFTEALSLFPLLNDLFGLTHMTHLVWRNILVT